MKCLFVGIKSFYSVVRAFPIMILFLKSIKVTTNKALNFIFYKEILDSKNVIELLNIY